MKKTFLISCVLLTNLAFAGRTFFSNPEKSAQPCSGIDLHQKTYKGTIISKKVQLTISFIEVNKPSLKKIKLNDQFVKVYSTDIKKIQLPSNIEENEKRFLTRIYTDFSTHLGLYEKGGQCHFAWLHDDKNQSEMSLYLQTNYFGRISLGGDRAGDINEESYWTREFF